MRRSSRLTADLSPATWVARKGWHDIFRVLNELPTYSISPMVITSSAPPQRMSSSHPNHPGNSLTSTPFSLLRVRSLSYSVIINWYFHSFSLLSLYSLSLISFHKSHLKQYICHSPTKSGNDTRKFTFRLHSVVNDTFPFLKKVTISSYHEVKMAKEENENRSKWFLNCHQICTGIEKRKHGLCAQPSSWDQFCATGYEKE